MKTPVAWRNISSSRQITRDRKSIIHQVREVYQNAREEEIGGNISAFWHDGRLVGLAWNKDGNDYYVIMPKTAYDIGVRCSIYPISPDQLCVLPCGYDDPETIHRLIQRYRTKSRVRENTG